MSDNNRVISSTNEERNNENTRRSAMENKIIFTQVHKIKREENIVEEKNTSNADLRGYVNSLMKDIIENRNYKRYKPVRETTEVNKIIEKCVTEGRLEEEEKHCLAEKYLSAEQFGQEKIKNLKNEIKRGYLIEALVEGEENDYYFVSKVEIDDFFDDELSKNRTGLPYKDKTLKSALFVYSKEKQREDILVLDKANTDYWIKQFLDVEELNGNERSTKVVFDIIDKAIKNGTIGAKEKENKSFVDYWNLRNMLITYFQVPRLFNYDEMTEHIFEAYEPENRNLVDVEKIKRTIFNKLNTDKQDTAFQIVPDMIKNKIKKTFKANSCVEIKIVSGTEAMKDLISSCMENDERYIKIKVDEEETYKAFYHRK